MAALVLAAFEEAYEPPPRSSLRQYLRSSHRMACYMHRQIAMRLSLIVLLAAFGCDRVDASKVPPGDGASSGVDTHDDAAAAADTADSDGGDCQGSLADVGGECPATFDGAPEHVPACGQGQVGAEQVWSCDGFVALSLGAGAHSVDCYYDTSADLLVGAMNVNDTNTLCGNSFTKTAGSVPPVACRYPVAMPTFYRQCGSP